MKLSSDTTAAKKKARRVSPSGFRIQIQPFGFIFIVATALTPDELQRLHYHGERA